MKIYEQEKRDGFEEALSKAAIAVDLFSKPTLFNAEACILRPKIGDDLKAILYSSSAGKEDLDLERGFSLFVSTGWNKNTDVFLSEEVWKSKSTPEDKPCNYNHDSSKIIGHMTSCMAVDDEYNIIGEKLNNFHLVNGYVIYKSLLTHGSDEVKGIVKEVLEGIADGTYYVSMEALFPNFDYALIDKSGAESLIPRNEESSFLTKHLVGFGGNGVFKDYRVGRVLRDITFSGKGFVKNPANPKSIIFRNTFSFNGVESSVAKIINQEIQMSAEVDTKLTAELDAAKAENKALKGKIDEFNAKAYEGKIKDLTDEVAGLKVKVDESDKALKSAEAKATSVEDLLKQAKADKENADKQIATLNTQLSEIKAKEKTVARTAVLKELVAKDKLDETLAKLADLNDEAFAHVTSLMPKLEKKEPTEAEKAEAAAKALENVKKEEGSTPNPSTNSVDDKYKTLASDVHSYVGQFHKQPKK